MTSEWLTKKLKVLYNQTSDISCFNLINGTVFTRRLKFVYFDIQFTTSWERSNLIGRLLAAHCSFLEAVIYKRADTMRNAQSQAYIWSYCLVLCVVVCDSMRMYVRRMVNLFHSIDTGDAQPANGAADGGVVALRHERLVSFPTSLRFWHWLALLGFLKVLTGLCTHQLTKKCTWCYLTNWKKNMIHYDRLTWDWISKNASVNFFVSCRYLYQYFCALYEHDAWSQRALSSARSSSLSQQ